MTEAKTSRVSSAEAVANLWNEMGVSYLVLHGLEGYPEQIGRDLDILMDQDVAETALAAAAGLLTERGWRCVRPPDLWGKRLVALRTGPGSAYDYLELHTMAHLRWFVVPLAGTSEEATGVVGPFTVSVWATFVKAFVLPLLAGDVSRYSSEYVRRHVQSGLTPEAIEPHCRRRFGDHLADSILAGLTTLDPRPFVDNRRRLRRSILKKLLRNPSETARGAILFAGNRLRRPMTSSALHAAIRTRDVSNCTSLIDAVVSRIRGVFVEIDVRAPGDPRRRGSRLSARQALLIDLREDPDLEQDRIRLSVGRRHTRDFSLNPGSSDAVDDIADFLIEFWIVAVGRHDPPKVMP